MLNNAFSNFLLTRKNISYFRETKLEGQENLLDTLIQCIKAGFSNQTFILGGFKYHFTKIDCTKVRIMCITSQIYSRVKIKWMVYFDIYNNQKTRHDTLRQKRPPDCSFSMKFKHKCKPITLFWNILFFVYVLLIQIILQSIE